MRRERELELEATAARLRDACTIDAEDRIEINRRMGPGYFEKIARDVDEARRRERRRKAAA